jgi:Putative methyltransferase
MGIIRKIHNKFFQFRQADRKLAWLLDQWYWRRFTNRHKKQIPINLAFDREHGVETAAEMPLETAGVPLADVERGNGIYRPLTEELFRSSLASIRIDASQFTFVDIGSGKGKVMFMAADLPFKRVVGIEYALGLHEVAVRNITAYRSATQKCHDIEAMHGDALQYSLPPGPVLLFTFNALSKEIMREMMIKLDLDAAANRDRPLFFIYTNLRKVAEVGAAFDGLPNLRTIRRTRNFVVVANDASRKLVG